jgi:hypothetical protein
MKKPASLVAAIVFWLIALAQLLRVLFRVQVTAGSHDIPLWLSSVASSALWECGSGANALATDRGRGGGELGRCGSRLRWLTGWLHNQPAASTGARQTRCLSRRSRSPHRWCSRTKATKAARIAGMGPGDYHSVDALGLRQP